MVPQLYISVYKEQFTSPRGAEKAELRPTSAHRRNNPQPRPDFLFPRSSNSHKSHSSSPVDIGVPLLPPVRHLSFHSPLPTGPDLKTTEVAKLQPMPPVTSPLPSSDRLQKLQLNQTPVNEIQLHTQRRVDYRRNVHPILSQQPGCYSCFQVVKPYQAGHYIIHPEFVSECLP